jgi:excisionase family DNA binding protein
VKTSRQLNLFYAATQPKGTRTKGEIMEASGGDSPYMRTSEASAYCKVARSTLWRAVKAGRLKQYGYGAAIRYRRDDLDRLMDARNRES